MVIAQANEGVSLEGIAAEPAELRRDDLRDLPGPHQAAQLLIAGPFDLQAALNVREDERAALALHPRPLNRQGLLLLNTGGADAAVADDKAVHDWVSGMAEPL